MVVRNENGAFANLPLVLAEIAEIVGEDVARLLADTYGGTEVFFPAFAPDDHWLARLVGREAADAICHHFRIFGSSGRPSGAYVLIPIWRQATLASDEAERTILESSERDAALLLGVHTRTIRRRRAKIRARHASGTRFRARSGHA